MENKKNKLEILDVTLRDGGFTCDFNWPMDFAKDYYNLMSKVGVSCVEMGYWKQTIKSLNPFYNLNMETLKRVTGGRGKNNVAVIIDYHYCSKDFNDYPTSENGEIKLIRMASRKAHLDKAISFSSELKKHTNIEMSLNLSNITNYTDNELNRVIDNLLESDFEYIYMADSHGCLDLYKDIEKYEDRWKKIKEAGKKTGIHLHNHLGKAYLNYIKCLESPYVDLCDTSIRSLGKGAGNLKLEEVLDDKNSLLVNEFISKYYNPLFNKVLNPYYNVTGRYNMTDNYATQAIKLKVPMDTFIEFCSTVSGDEKGYFNKKLLEVFDEKKYL